MTLAGRACLALLATLAVALAGAGAGVYWIVRSALSQRIDQRLDGAIDALGALVELEPGGLEWDVENRSVTIGGESHDDEIRWLVVDGEGRRVADSDNLRALAVGAVADLASCAAGAGAARSLDTIDWLGSRWRRVCVRRVTPAPGGLPAVSPRPTAPVVHRELVIVAALPLRSFDLALAHLLVWSTGLSLSILLAAALASRRLLRHALSPLERMAASADDITAADLRRRLPSPGTDVVDRLAAAFNDLLGRVEQAYSTQRRLAADASHQLRTPLTAQIGQIEVALRRERSPDEYREILSRVLARAQQMSGIVEGLLSLARLETEGGRPQIEQFDVGDWLREHAGSWSQHPRQADFRVRLPDSGLRIRASSAWLAQVVDALVENACKYSAAGTPIEIRARRAESGASIEVEDHGIGMSEDERRRAFEPYFRSSGARTGGLPGLGLGLSIAARLTDVMGGRIEARSVPGAGSTFTILLPVERDVESAAAT